MNEEIKRFLGSGESGTESIEGVDKEEAELQKNNIDNDPYDRLVYRSLLEDTDLGDLSEEGEEDYSPFPSLLEDVFDIFYKRSPELTENEVEEDYQQNRQFLEEIIDNEETGKVRANTRLDDMMSAISTVSTGKKLLEVIREQEESGSGDGSGESSDQESQEGQGNQPLDKQTKNDIQQALSEAARESEEMSEAAANWGLEEGELNRVPISDRFKFAEALSNKRLRYLANLVGKAMNLLSASKIEKMKGGNEEIQEISFGGDLSKVMPQELVLLRHPKRKKEFLRRFADNQLLSYEYSYNEKQNRGPLVILVDTSGSMDSENRIDGAIATSLALVNVAVRKQRRRAVVKFFNTQVKASFSFSPSDIAGMMSNLSEMAQIGTSGGTAYYQPISEGLGECKGKFKKADLLMLTDGQCSLYGSELDEILRVKQEKKVGVYTVLFEEMLSTESLEQFSDEIYQASNLIDDPEVITKLGASISH